MKCLKCSAENPEKKKFCRACGAKLAQACPQCGAEISPGAVSAASVEVT